MAIPPQLAEAWGFLHTEVVWLHGRWEIYADLYGASPERIGLLNRTVPTFFAILQGIWLNDLQLTLSKLADPAAMFKRPNLTLETLLQAVSERPEPQLATKMRTLLAHYRTACAKVKARRNKDIAHFDFATQISPARKVEILPGPSRQEIDAALLALREFMKEVYGHFTSGSNNRLEWASSKPAAQPLRVISTDILLKLRALCGDMTNLCKVPTYGRRDITEYY